MSSRRLYIALRIAGVILLAVLVYVFAHHVDWDVLGHALRTAELWPLVLAMLLFFATLFGKALAWRILLAPRSIVPIGRLYRYTIAAFAGSVLAPARAGEVLRVLALKTRDKVPTAESAAIAVTDKLLHAVSLLVLAAPLPLVVPELPAWVEHSMLVGGSIAVAALAAIYIAVARAQVHEPQSWFARFLGGLHAFREPRRLLGALGVITLVWLLDMLSIVAVLRAVDVDVSLSSALFVLFTINVSIAAPTTPANIGPLQLGALLATRLLGIPSEPALAFALLYHAIQIFPLLIVGFVLEFRLVIPGGTRGKLAP